LSQTISHHKLNTIFHPHIAQQTGPIEAQPLFHNCARSYYKVNQSFLVDLFFIGFMLKVAGVGRSRPWDIDPVRNTVHPLLIETCLRLVGTQIPYNKRSYDTISIEEANRQIY